MASVAATTGEATAKADDMQAFETGSTFTGSVDKANSTLRDTRLQGSATWGLRNSKKPEQGGEIRHAGKPEQSVEIQHTGPERHDKEECQPMWWKDMKETVARKKRLEAATGAEEAGESASSGDASPTSGQVGHDFLASSAKTERTRLSELTSDTLTSYPWARRRVSGQVLSSDTLASYEGTRSRVSRHCLTCDTLAPYSAIRDSIESLAPRAPSSGAPVSGRPSSAARRLATGIAAGTQVRAVLALVQEEHAVRNLDPDQRTMPYFPARFPLVR